MFIVFSSLKCLSPILNNNQRGLNSFCRWPRHERRSRRRRRYRRIPLRRKNGKCGLKKQILLFLLLDIRKEDLNALLSEILNRSFQSFGEIGCIGY